MEPDNDKTQTHVVLTKGTMVSHYRIVEKIGAGGMGEVYLAEDTHLHRQVALKFLPAQYAADSDFKTRFVREAEAAAKLNHPNIITIYDVAEYHGRPFFAMELVEGQSLRDLIKTGDIGIDRAVDLTIQVCEGLGKAHLAGITHRDVKPSNIVIDADGRPKLLDFGLAAVRGGEDLTRTGSTLGTVGYMSPGQVRGDEPDARSDLFSLGVVLYEMITGVTPFRGENEATTLKAILEKTPEPLARYKSDVPDDLQRIVSKLLEKDRDLRYQSAADVVSDLKRLRRDSESAIVPQPQRTSSSRMARFLVPALILIVAVVVLVLKPWKFELQPTEEVIAAENRLAIMYFDNLADPEDSLKLGEIATNLLITDLSESRYVNVISSQRLYDILKQLGKEGQKRIDRDVVSQVAQTARARWMLLGSILKVTPQIVITTRLVDVESGQVDASQQITGGDDEDIFSIIDKLTVEIKSDLSLPAAALEEQDRSIADVTTSSPLAYRYYLEGLDYYYRLSFDEQAKESFERALEVDSTFAMAHLRLAIRNVFADRAILSSEERESVAKAGEYSGMASRKERMYIEVIQEVARGDYMAAVGKLTRISRHFPQEKEALLLSGLIQLFRLRQPHGAIEAFTKALEIDPLYKLGFNYLSYAYVSIGDFESAIAAVNEYISLVPDEPNPYDTRGDVFYFRRDADLAIASYMKANEMNPGHPQSTAKLAETYTFKGDFARADSLCRSLVSCELARYRSWGRLSLALNAAYQGKLEKALQFLDDGIGADRLEQASQRLIEAKWRAKARVHDERKQFDSAILETEKAFEDYDRRHPDDPYNCSPLYVRLLAANGDFVKAEARLKAGLERKRGESRSDSLSYWLASGYIAYYKGDLETSLEHFRSAAKGELLIADLSSIYFEAHLMLAIAYLESERYDAAVGEFENLLSSYSWKQPFYSIWSVKTHYYLGQAYEQSGRTDKAIEQYETFLDIWKNADEGLKSVEDAKTRLARLKGES